MADSTDRLHFSARAKAAVLWIAAGIALLFLWQVRDVLTPFIWAIITAYVLNPVVGFLSRRTNLPRRLWAVIFYLVLLGLLVWGLGTVVPMLSRQLTEFVRELPSHVREAGFRLREMGLLSGDTIDILGFQLNLNASDPEIIRQLSSMLSQQIAQGAIPAITRGFEGVLKLLVYLVATFFLLLEIERIGDGVSRYTPENMRIELGPWIRRINYVLGAYIRGQIVLVLLMSFASYVMLTAMHVRFAGLLAIFTGLVETIPFIGPYTAGGTAVLVAITQNVIPYGWTPTGLAFAVAIGYTVLRQLEDNFVMPFLIGRLVRLHPLVIIFSVLAGASIAGILGLLLAVPVAATVKIVITYFYGKLNEEPPRALVVIDETDGWDEITAHVREAVMASKSNGAGVPHLLISAPLAPIAIADQAGFQRLKFLLDESRSDVVLRTSDPLLVSLADQAGIPTQEEPAPPRVSAPEPDYVEAEPNTFLDRMRHRGAEEKEPGRRGLFVTRPLAQTPKEADEDHPV